MSDNRKYTFAAASIVLGLGAFLTLQFAMTEMQIVVDACRAAPGNMKAFEATYHPYEPWLGGPMTCLWTQFGYDLVVNFPAGFLVWGTTMTCVMPFMVALVVEAGRSGAKGLLRWPSIILFLGQALGYCVVFPTLWIPSYILGRSTGLRGSVSSARGKAALALALPHLILTALVFLIKPDKHFWTIAAGILFGPVLGFFPAIAWSMDPPTKPHVKDLHMILRAYSIAGGAAFTLWCIIVFVAFSHYGFEYKDLIQDIWTQANPSVAFMTVDMIGVYSSLLLYIAYCSPLKAMEALLHTLFFGPGAACAAIMAEMEMDRVPTELLKKDAIKED